MPDAARPTASGPGRVLIAVYGIFALSATARAGVQLAARFSEAPVPYLLSALAGVVYILATVGLAGSGPGARRLAWAAVGFELAGVLVVGTLTVLSSSNVPDSAFPGAAFPGAAFPGAAFPGAAFPDDTVWSYYGRGYGFVPLVLPLVGLWWLRRTRAR